MNKVLKGTLIFTAGFSIGAAVSAVVTKAVVEQQAAEDLADLRESYESKLPKPERQAKDDDTVTTDGVPEQKQVDTHKTNYAGYSKKEKKAEKAESTGGYKLTEEQKEKVKKAQNTPPTEEDDDPDEIIEIREYDDELTGEDGYGYKAGYGVVEMEYYTQDGCLKISDWGDLEPLNEGRSDLEIMSEEDEIVHDILPYLDEIGFAAKPYDRIYLRNRRRSLDVQVTKLNRSGLSESL